MFKKFKNKLVSDIEIELYSLKKHSNSSKINPLKLANKF
jgi:hypothetical protein